MKMSSLISNTISFYVIIQYMSKVLLYISCISEFFNTNIDLI